MSSKSSGSGQSTPTAPPWLMNLLQGEAGGTSGLPTLGQLFNSVPELGIGPMGMQDIFGSQYSANHVNPWETAGASGLESFVGSPGKPSSATNAAIKEFNDIQTPQLMNQAASMGLGNSGAALEAISQGQEQAEVPFLQQDLQNSLNASNSLSQLGLAQKQLKGNQLEQAFGMAQQPEQNLFNMLEQRFGLASGVDQQILGLIGNLFGNKQNQSSSGFDLSSLF